ncbi:hypothetical protein UlMin_023959 [Ulmus minor]
MTSEDTQGEKKAIWDSKTHDIWVDLAVEKYIYWKNFIENFNKATSRNYERKKLKNHWEKKKKKKKKKDWAWAPSFNLQPPLFMQDSTNDDNVNENANLDSKEAYQEVVECINHYEKELRPKRKQFKKERKNNSTTTKLSKQVDEIVDAIKSRKVLDKLAMLPGCQPMSPVFKLGTGLFVMKANREIFAILSEPEYQIEWLKDQQSQL